MNKHHIKIQVGERKLDTHIFIDEVEIKGCRTISFEYSVDLPIALLTMQIWTDALEVEGAVEVLVGL